MDDWWADLEGDDRACLRAASFLPATLAPTGKARIAPVEPAVAPRS